MMKKRNEVYVGQRMLNRWAFDFARHLQSIVYMTVEEEELKKPECADGHLSDKIVRQDYLKGLEIAKKYFEAFDSKLLAQHKIEKSEEDFYRLMNINIKKVRRLNDSLLMLQNF